MWENWNPCTLLMEMLNDASTLKSSLCVCVSHLVMSDSLRPHGL